MTVPSMYHQPTDDGGLVKNMYTAIGEANKAPQVAIIQLVSSGLFERRTIKFQDA